MTAKANNNQFSLQIGEDRAMLIICIGIAFIFWLLVKLSQQYPTKKAVTINYTLPEGKALSTLPPTDLTVSLSGNGWDLMYEYFSNPKLMLFFDLRQVSQLDLNRGQLTNAIEEQLSTSDINILQINHDRLFFELEDLLEQKVPIVLKSQLSFSDDYQLKDTIRITPDSIVLQGPVTKVREIQYWATDSILLSDLKSDAVQQLALQQPPPEITLSQAQIEVSVPVEQYTQKSFFVPIIIKNTTDSIRIFPERIKLNCVVGLSQYNEVSGEDFKIEIDLKDVPIKENKNTVPIILAQKPNYVKSVSFSPKSAEFFLITPKDEK